MCDVAVIIVGVYGANVCIYFHWAVIVASSLNLRSMRKETLNGILLIFAHANVCVRFFSVYSVDYYSGNRIQHLNYINVVYDF